jgi:hypothetical protein
MQKFIPSIHKSIIIIFFTAITATLNACDICGSGLRDASFSMGYLQTIPSHFLGVWGNSLGFNTQTGYSNGTKFTVSDRILQTGIVFNQQINQKLQINYRQGIQQISRHNEDNENKTNTYSGLSDLSVAVNYTLIDSRKFAIKKTKQLGLTSLNVKIPNGHYQLRDGYKRMLPMNLQPGNGSYGIGGQVLYGIFKNGWNWNMQLSAFYNFENELKYQQGDNQIIRSGIGKAFSSKKNICLPMLGYQYQQFGPDLTYRERVTTTGGNVQTIFIQLEWIRQNFYGRFQGNIPLKQTLPDFAPQSTSPIMLTLGWLINQNSEDIKSFD